ncbi:hypothetical protein Tco_1153496 [Tanacetum coccineum]
MSPPCFVMNKFRSIESLKNPLDTRKLESSSYHTRGACLISYNDFLRCTSYSNSPQPYYVTHPSSVVDYEEDYQGELHWDSQEDKLPTIIMLLARDGRVDIQTKNARYGGNGNRNAGRQNRNQAFNARNMTDESNQIVQRVPRTESNPRKEKFQCYNLMTSNNVTFIASFIPLIMEYLVKIRKKAHILELKRRHLKKLTLTSYTPYPSRKIRLSYKDEAGSNLYAEENDFMLHNSFGDETLEELTAAVIMMARIQPADGNAVTELTYDAKAISEVNASHKAHKQVNHVKRKTIIHASDDGQIDSNIIFDDPYVENNGGTSVHDSTDHDEYHNIQILAYNVQREAENKKRLNNELKKQKVLLQKELDTCKERVKTFESKTIQCSKYKETCEELEREVHADKDTIERILKEKDKIESDFFKIESDFFKIENEKIIIQHETQLAKKAFKEREN